MSPRDEIRARAKELGIKNVSKYTVHELAAQIEMAERIPDAPVPGVEEVIRSAMHAEQAATEDLLIAARAGDREAVEAAIADFEGPKTLVYNRSEMRRFGSLFAYYRQPKRAAGRKTGSAAHWLSRLISGRPSKSEYLKAQREAKA